MSKKTDDLDKAFGSGQTLKTSIGTLEISPFKMKQLTKAASAFASISGAINVDKAGKMNGVDLRTLIYVLCENDMGSVVTLCELASGKEREFLEGLEALEFMELVQKVFEIAIQPIVKKLESLIPKTDESKDLTPTGET